MDKGYKATKAAKKKGPIPLKAEERAEMIQIHLLLLLFGVVLYVSGVLMRIRLFDLTLLHVTTFVFMAFTPVILYTSSERRDFLRRVIVDGVTFSSAKTAFGNLRVFMVYGLIANIIVDALSGILMFGGTKTPLLRDIHLFGIILLPVLILIHVVIVMIEHLQKERKL